MDDESPRSFVDSPRICRWKLGDVVAVRSQWSQRKDHCGWVTRLPDPYKKKGRVTVQFADGQKVAYAPQNLRVPHNAEGAMAIIEKNPHYIIFSNEFLIYQKKQSENLVDEKTKTSRRNTRKGMTVDVQPDVIGSGEIDTPQIYGQEHDSNRRVEAMLETIVKQMDGLSVRIGHMEERLVNLESDSLAQSVISE